MSEIQTAFVFPGQGSQIVGMGKDIHAAYPDTHALFAQADAAFGVPFTALMFEGAQAELDDTFNTQPALYVCSMAIFHALGSALPALQPAFVAGHSLGEISALAAAGVLTYADGLRVVRERGRAMQAAGVTQPGAMAAILNLDTDAVRGLCAQVAADTGKTLVLANDNCPGQVVISGDVEAIDAGIAAAKTAGAKRALKLAVSIASHSPLMQPAAEQFGHTLDATAFHAPRIPVFTNTTAAPQTHPDALREGLRQQLTSSVRWTETIHNLRDAGVTRFIEIGSKDVLTGLIKRIAPDADTVTLNSAAALHVFVQNHA